MVSNTFFNYSLYCYFSSFFSFFIELSLLFFIIFNILFIDVNLKKNKNSFFFFLSFLIILLLYAFFILFFNFNIYILSFSLQNNYYIFFSKTFCLCLLIIILYVIKNKLLENIYSLNLKDFFCIICFLLIFLCILLSSVDFFIMFLSLEGISFILYTLGTILKTSYINLEAILKYFLINNIASSLLL